MVMIEMVVAVVVMVVLQLTLRNAPAQLRLDGVVILLINYIVHRVPVNQKVLLEDGGGGGRRSIRKRN